jgi:hypothetical protein
VYTPNTESLMQALRGIYDASRVVWTVKGVGEVACVEGTLAAAHLSEALVIAKSALAWLGYDAGRITLDDTEYDTKLAALLATARDLVAWCDELQEAADYHKQAARRTGEDRERATAAML